MTGLLMETAIQGEVALTVLRHLRDGRIKDAIACFAEKFRFNDRGIGLEFKDRDRLAEFFLKTRELYPDSSLQTERILVSGDDVVAEWTLRATLIEPLYGDLSRNTRISLPGVSIVRVKNGKITDWTDYYDGVTARRTALASYFGVWGEL
jgi:steroid delta-isomerase-like uncharacterized protein